MAEARREGRASDFDLTAVAMRIMLTARCWPIRAGSLVRSNGVGSTSTSGRPERALRARSRNFPADGAKRKFVRPPPKNDFLPNCLALTQTSPVRANQVPRAG